MARTWKDRVAEGFVFYLQEAVLTDAWTKRAELSLIIKLILDLSQCLRRAPGARARINVPMELAHKVRPGQIEQMEDGSNLTLNELWGRLCEESPQSAARMVWMSVPQAAIDVASDILGEVVSPTVKHPLSIAHRVVGGLARHAASAGWANACVDRSTPTSAVAYVGILARVAAACADFTRTAPRRNRSAGMAALIGNHGPPCLILPNHSLELPEELGIVATMAVLPTPLRLDWRRDGQTVLNLQNFLKDIFKKADITDNDGERWAIGRRKEFNRIRRYISHLNRWSDANRRSFPSKTLLEMTNAEQKMMIAYWAFCRRTWEKLHSRLKSGQLRKDIYPSHYSVCSHNSFPSFADDPAIARELGWIIEVSTDAEHHEGEEGPQPGPADGLTRVRTDIAERLPSPATLLRERRLQNRKDRSVDLPFRPLSREETVTARDREVFESYTEEIYQYASQQVAGHQAIGDNLLPAERAAWRAILRSYPDDILELSGSAPAFDLFLREVVIGYGSPAHFFLENEMNGHKRLAILEKFVVARKKYSPEIARAIFEGMFGFDPVNTGFDELDAETEHEGACHE